MPRIRSIKPEFFLNDEMADLDPLTRLFFIGLWTQADREGRLYDRPRRLKVSLMPYDECDIDTMLDTLAASGQVLRYEADGEHIIQVTHFTKHQMPHYKEPPSLIPPPHGHTDSGVSVPALTDAERSSILERDGSVCCECGSVDDPTIDHIIPKSLGGTNDPSNLRVLCRRCNSAKNNRISSQSRADVGSTMTQGREGKGKERKGAGEESTRGASFDDAWEAYPLHRYKEKARLAFDAADDDEQIVVACRNAPRDTKQSLGFFITDGTYRDFVPKPKREKCAVCGGNGHIPEERDGELVAVHCPKCGGR